MSNTDFLSRFQKVFLCATEIYSKKVTPEHAQVFFDLVRDFDIADIEKAFYQHMRSSRFFPVPADIIDLITSGKTSQLRQGQIFLDGNRKYKVLN